MNSSIASIRSTFGELLHRWRIAIIFGSICLAMAFFFTGLINLQDIVWSRTISLWVPLKYELLRRGLWFLYLPIVLITARRLPLGNSVHRKRNITLHFVISIVVAMLYGLLTVTLIILLFGKPTTGEYAKLNELESWKMYYTTFLVTVPGVFLSTLLYWILLGGIHLMDYYRRYKAEELRSAKLETDLAQAQLQALKMQLHPHFLFNSLNSISALLYKDPRRADSMIARLGDFLRMTLDNPSTQFITLQNELDLLKCYVDIEMLRFPRRLHVEMNIEQGLQDVEVPNLLLQPLVENAVKYGVLKSSDGGRIRIIARRLPANDNVLELSVRDNGPGMQINEKHSQSISFQGRVGKRLTKQSSIGLQNTRERLEKLYGERFRFDYYNAPEGGFVVHIEIPLRITASLEESAEHSEASGQWANDDDLMTT